MARKIPNLAENNFKKREEIYFKSSIDAIPYNGFINKYQTWTNEDLINNHNEQIEVLRGWYFVI